VTTAPTTPDHDLNGPAVDVRRAEDRFHTRIGWLDSWHSFSFSEHYDPTNVHHGQLLVLNDDTVAPSAGFGTHAHADMEIVTWVLDGRLEHRDSAGNHGELYPGLAQRMSAGSGIRHSEQNPDPDLPVHFLQMWVVPDTRGVEPGYEQLDVNDRLDSGELVPVASGRDLEGTIHLHQRDATMWVGRLASGTDVEVPVAPHVHVFLARGAAAFDRPGDDRVELGAGDAVRLTDAGPTTLTSTDDGTEVVVWATA
jgi:redox-sensitive bicupin YhaK (pirin superfamily)